MHVVISDQNLNRIDQYLCVLGGVLWLMWLAPAIRRRRDPLAIARTNSASLPLMGAAICMFVYLLAAGSVQTGVESLLQGAYDKNTALRIAQLAAASGGALAGSIACVWVVVASFPGGLRRFGLRARGAGRAAVAGVGGVLMAFPLCWALLWMSERGMQSFGWKLPEHPVLDALAHAGLPLWARVLATVSPLVLAPIAEELFFRGVIQNVIRRYVPSPWLVVVLGSLLFGAAHFKQPQAVLPLTALGMLLGYVYEKHRSFVGPIVLHVLFNGHTLLWYALK